MNRFRYAIGSHEEESMLRPEDLSFLDEEAVEEPSELLKALPEIGQHVTPAAPEDDLGLRSLLERPETFAHAWWRDQASRSGRTTEPRLRPTRPHAA
jgi:hypothetical protein